MDAKAAFLAIDERVLRDQRDQWEEQEQQALQNQAADPSVMDVFEIKINKGGHNPPLLIFAHGFQPQV